MKITFIDKNTQKEISIFKLITEADVKVMSSGNIIKTLDGKRYLIESIEYLISENEMEVMIYITENICNSLLIVLFVPNHIIRKFGPPHIYKLTSFIENKLDIQVLPLVSEKMDFDIKILNPKMIDINDEELDMIKNKIHEMILKHVDK